MNVVGGTYREHCLNPSTNLLRGSGLRAASVLAGSRSGVRLQSAIELEGREEASIVAGGLGVETEWHTRSQPVRFSYFTPLSVPALDGCLSQIDDDIVVSGDVVLAFGMVEATHRMRVRASTCVFDPQQPGNNATLDVGQLECDRLAIVANAQETCALGHDPEVASAASNIVAEAGADVVVTKQAAKGALVTTAEGQEKIGPFPTRSVRPIGSGDVFAAAFASAWGEDGLDEIASARQASRFTAHWCSTTYDLRLIDEPRSSELSELSVGRDMARVYLASPFFNLSERWIVELVRDSLIGLGGDVFSPFHDVGPGGDEVAAADLAGLESSSALLALLDGADAGTLFECGVASSRSLPVVGYAESPDPEGSKMLIGTGAELYGDLSTAVYRAIWRSFGADPFPKS
jgi:Nucleoside 2-deoxyribosyltransferase/pfkB family carbohydrate kinase